ncbi:ATP-binding cassette domain-containing protein [Paenibacillus sp. GSMTC-2017]|uniref:ABC transporter ATP-binding protein n=1 Tax=Paenibacillus sp. GSMTC-2017 TaxID=2794350 RepID=UPI0018D673D4|nr:ATP-binding cassette domain-containing protein [Paenibacillus sp. GSMTC-2017]MBH5317321.1 ATP-binding cassette domain-containing protein [Paenibacillus sp. GSMTC-2017]
MAAILDIAQLAKKSWKKDNKQSPYLFDEVTAVIKQPEFISVIGSSGQGKSTLLRTLAMLETPDKGDMLFKGTSYRMKDARAWRKQICYVPQQAVMLNGSVEDNLRTASRLHGNTYDDQLASHLLAEAMLDGLDRNKKASELSGGEKQRVALIRSLLLRPSILLLDEITASLDSISGRAVEQLLQRWHVSEGVTIIWVTHDLEQVRRTSSRTWFMSEGTLLEDRGTLDFFRQPATESGNHFLRYLVSEVTT